jgi:CBS domain-containing protein
MTKYRQARIMLGSTLANPIGKEGAMNVREIMTSNPACCTRDTPLSEVARTMVDRDCGQIPVVDNFSSRKVVGVITDRDIVVRAVAQGQNPVEMSAGDVMSSPVATVKPEAKIEECCRTLEDLQIRRAPVADESGQCCGIVSLADIAQSVPDRITAEVVKTISQPGTGMSRTLVL